MAVTSQARKRRRCARLPGLILAALCSLAFFGVHPTNLLAVAEQKILVDQTPNGYRLRYEDPDYDNEWREHVVVSADRLVVHAQTAIRAYDKGRWLYTYGVSNSAESQQSVVSFAIQATYGSEANSPFGWDVVKTRNSIFTWKTVQSSGLVPAESGYGWSIVSDSLPVVRQAQVRGRQEDNIAFLDLPETVRQRVADLERRNAASSWVLAPGIATRIITVGQEGERDAHDVFDETNERYPRWLRDAAAAADARGKGHTRLAPTGSNAAWAERVCQQLDEARLILKTNRSAAGTHFANLIKRLDESKPDDVWLEQVRQALSAVLEYVHSRL